MVRTFDGVREAALFLAMMEGIADLTNSNGITEYSIQAALGSKKWVLLPIVSFLLLTYYELGYLGF